VKPTEIPRFIGCSVNLRRPAYESALCSLYGVFGLFGRRACTQNLAHIFKKTLGCGGEQRHFLGLCHRPTTPCSIFYQAMLDLSTYSGGAKLSDCVPLALLPPLAYTAVGKALHQDTPVWVVCGYAKYPDGKTHVLVWEASVKLTNRSTIRVRFTDGTQKAFLPSSLLTEVPPNYPLLLAPDDAEIPSEVVPTGSASEEEEAEDSDADEDVPRKQKVRGRKNTKKHKPVETDLFSSVSNLRAWQARLNAPDSRATALAEFATLKKADYREIIKSYTLVLAKDKSIEHAHKLLSDALASGVRTTALPVVLESTFSIAPQPLTSMTLPLLATLFCPCL
jgi:hypothetical protein